MSGAEWTLTGIVIAGAAILGLTGPRACQALHGAILRARWAWRCRGQSPPRSETAPLTYDEIKTLAAIAGGRKRTARPERTRT